MNKLLALAGVATLALSVPAIAQDSMGATTDPAGTAATTAPTDPSMATPTDTPSTAAPASTTGAQPADSMASDSTATDATGTATAQGAMPADGSQPAQATASTAPAATGAATQTASADATSKVQADWAKYDKAGKGQLTALEFGTWIMAANGQDMTAQVESSKTSKRANLPAVKVLNATATEFGKADTDKSKTVSPEELATYLSAGQPS